MKLGILMFALVFAGAQSSLLTTVSLAQTEEMAFREDLASSPILLEAEKLLRRAEVIKELELSDEQIKQLKELKPNRIEKVGRGLRLEIKKLPAENHDEELGQQQSKEKLAQLNEILLPDQAIRLAQLQYQMSRRSGLKFLTVGPVAKELRLNEAQKEELKAKAKELRLALKAKVAKLKNEMQDKLIDTLPAAQKEKLRFFEGEAFKFEKRQ